MGPGSGVLWSDRQEPKGLWPGLRGAEVVRMESKWDSGPFFRVWLPHGRGGAESRLRTKAE